ncbi:hypothetical protein BGX28_007685 [Mortierella sp. GBA30]|nr:hypothetical protein BGX28_007685 [Mortierella sp. GBA30]
MLLQVLECIGSRCDGSQIRALDLHANEKMRATELGLDTATELDRLFGTGSFSGLRYLRLQGGFVDSQLLGALIKGLDTSPLEGSGQPCRLSHVFLGPGSVTDSAIEKLVAAAGHCLEVFTVTSCVDVGGKSLASLLTKCPKLRVLGVHKSLASDKELLEGLGIDVTNHHSVPSSISNNSTVQQSTKRKTIIAPLERLELGTVKLTTVGVTEIVKGTCQSLRYLYLGSRHFKEEFLKGVVLPMTFVSNSISATPGASEGAATSSDRSTATPIIEDQDTLLERFHPEHNNFHNRDDCIVLVIGATGYIGLRVVQQLRRANHIVYGTTRSTSKEHILLVNEVIPVVGPIEPEHRQTPAWIDVVKKEHIEVVIDLAGVQTTVKSILEPLVRLSKDRQSAHQSKIGFIYCSGIWLHGSGFEPSSDLDSVGVKASLHQPPALVAWRPEIEREVLASYDHLNALVLRPALVYGGTADIWDHYLGQIYQSIQKNTPISLAANPDAAPGLIHVDDVASGFVTAVEKIELIAGRKNFYPIFDLATSHENLGFILKRAAAELGYQGKVEFTGVPEGDTMPQLFIQAFNTTANAESTRARTVLGWTPTKTGMAAGIQIYVKSWLAGYQEKQRAAK